MDKLDLSKLDPSILNKPLSELEIKPGEVNEGFKGIPVVLPEGMTAAEGAEGGEGTPNSSEDGSKVPYTRFKKFHDRALEAEEEADYWHRKATQREDRYAPPTPANIAPSYEGDDWLRFKTLFGDSPQSREAYKLELQRTEAIESRATERAMEAMERRSSQEQQQYRGNLEVLEDNLSEASDILGRTLTSDEELAILDIQDDYSPKDRDGNISALIPVEKAVEIYQLQHARSPRREARNSVAALSGGSSAGEVATSEQNKEFNPRGGWRQMFKK